MNLSILRMISPGSLSAFSASASNGAVGRAAAPEAIQQVRALAPQPRNGLAASPGGRNFPPATQPSQNLPRGSLLDLSV